MYTLDILGPVREPLSYAGLRIVLGGNSDDTKPTDVLAGSRFFEDDTGDKYVFDGTSTWTKYEAAPAAEANSD